MSKNWHTGIATHQGTRKTRNEDSYLIRFRKDNKDNEIALFVVADGMGGYQVGDTASRLAITAIDEWWERRIDKVLKRRNVTTQVVKEVQKLFLQINKAIIQAGKNIDKKMGTTLSLLVLYNGNYGIVHVGDSRVYQMKDLSQRIEEFVQQIPQHLFHEQTEILEREPELHQLTEDHSWVEKQVREGKLTREEARNHPKRNVLLQCLGIGEEIHPYSTLGSYRTDDVFLLCSDGFYSLFSNEEIKNMILNLEKEYGNYQAVCDYLINFSNFSHAHDNVTLMLVRDLQYQDSSKNKSAWWLTLMDRKA
ncbi:PP2C family serine/threonine-protein phosphatase [Paucisalibacillus sp. EB02]|uniref:PP2C family protein-serine/threonine phosphatase n=1 Tax=Paucisalibacillus sp. EB02 TaxID=1347087 RepID=UPI0005AA4BD7|nr:protein phosphatase 2C domain-containing protein [Paucisalibacillus sp. EB02]